MNDVRKTIISFNLQFELIKKSIFQVIDNLNEIKLGLIV